jgi:mono/diheme cytochrome c family protein
MRKGDGEHSLFQLYDVSLRSLFRRPGAIGLAVAITVGLVVSQNHAGAQTRMNSSKSSESLSESAENGKRLFQKDGCYECHGSVAQGGGYNGPRLAPNPAPLTFILAYVRKPNGAMPPYTEKVISDKQLTDIYAFLKSVPQPRDPKTIPALNK